MKMKKISCLIIIILQFYCAFPQNVVQEYYKSLPNGEHIGKFKNGKIK